MTRKPSNRDDLIAAQAELILALFDFLTDSDLDDFFEENGNESLAERVQDLHAVYQARQEQKKLQEQLAAWEGKGDAHVG